MITAIQHKEKLFKEINELPIEAIPELLNFVEYLRFKVKPSSQPLEESPDQSNPSSSFLLSIAELGFTEEDDISERDEELLANEIDSIRGWGLGQNNSQ